MIKKKLFRRIIAWLTISQIVFQPIFPAAELILMSAVSAKPVLAGDKCDGWADSGSEHRNSGNGCFYRCDGGGWSGPTHCDGQGNGQFQGEAAKTEEERRQQDEAVRDRERQAKEQIEKQGGAESEETRRVAEETARQRAGEEQKQREMAAAQLAAARAEADRIAAENAAKAEALRVEAERRAQEAAQKIEAITPQLPAATAAPAATTAPATTAVSIPTATPAPVANIPGQAGDKAWGDCKLAGGSDGDCTKKAQDAYIAQEHKEIVQYIEAGLTPEKYYQDNKDRKQKDAVNGQIAGEVVKQLNAAGRSTSDLSPEEYDRIQKIIHLELPQAEALNQTLAQDRSEIEKLAAAGISGQAAPKISSVVQDILQSTVLPSPTAVSAGGSSCGSANYGQQSPGADGKKYICTTGNAWVVCPDSQCPLVISQNQAGDAVFSGSRIGDGCSGDGNFITKGGANLDDCTKQNKVCGSDSAGGTACLLPTQIGFDARLPETKVDQYRFNSDARAIEKLIPDGTWEKVKQCGSTQIGVRYGGYWDCRESGLSAQGLTEKLAEAAAAANPCTDISDGNLVRITPKNFCVVCRAGRPSGTTACPSLQGGGGPPPETNIPPAQFLGPSERGEIIRNLEQERALEVFRCGEKGGIWASNTCFSPGRPTPTEAPRVERSGKVMVTSICQGDRLVKTTRTANSRGPAGETTATESCEWGCSGGACREATPEQALEQRQNILKNAMEREKLKCELIENDRDQQRCLDNVYQRAIANPQLEEKTSPTQTRLLNKPPITGNQRKGFIEAQFQRLKDNSLAQKTAAPEFQYSVSDTPAVLTSQEEAELWRQAEAAVDKALSLGSLDPAGGNTLTADSPVWDQITNLPAARAKEIVQQQGSATFAGLEIPGLGGIIAKQIFCRLNKDYYRAYPLDCGVTAPPTAVGVEAAKAQFSFLISGKTDPKIWDQGMVFGDPSSPGFQIREYQDVIAPGCGVKPEQRSLTEEETACLTGQIIAKKFDWATVEERNRQTATVNLAAAAAGFAGGIAGQGIKAVGGTAAKALGTVVGTGAVSDALLAPVFAEAMTAGARESAAALTVLSQSGDATDIQRQVWQDQAKTAVDTAEAEYRANLVTGIVMAGVINLGGEALGATVGRGLREAIGDTAVGRVLFGSPRAAAVAARELADVMPFRDSRGNLWTPTGEAAAAREVLSGDVWTPEAAVFEVYGDGGLGRVSTKVDQILAGIDNGSLRQGSLVAVVGRDGNPRLFRYAGDGNLVEWSPVGAGPPAGAVPELGGARVTTPSDVAAAADSVRGVIDRDTPAVLGNRRPQVVVGPETAGLLPAGSEVAAAVDNFPVRPSEGLFDRAAEVPAAIGDAVGGATAAVRNAADDAADGVRVLTNCGVAMSPIPQAYAAGGGCITIPSGKTDVPELGEGVSVKPDPAAQAVEIYTPGAEPVVVRQGETGVLPTGEKVHVVAVKSDRTAVMEPRGQAVPEEKLAAVIKDELQDNPDLLSTVGPFVNTARQMLESKPDAIVLPGDSAARYEEAIRSIAKANGMEEIPTIIPFPTKEQWTTIRGEIDGQEIEAGAVIPGPNLLAYKNLSDFFGPTGEKAGVDGLMKTADRVLENRLKATPNDKRLLEIQAILKSSGEEYYGNSNWKPSVEYRRGLLELFYPEQMVTLNQARSVAFFDDVSLTGIKLCCYDDLFEKDFAPLIERYVVLAEKKASIPVGVHIGATESVVEYPFLREFIEGEGITTQIVKLHNDAFDYERLFTGSPAEKGLQRETFFATAEEFTKGQPVPPSPRRTQEYTQFLREKAEPPMGVDRIRNAAGEVGGGMKKGVAVLTESVTDAIGGATAAVRNAADDAADGVRVLTNCGIGMSPVPQVYAAGGGCITIPSGKTDVPELGEGVSVRPDAAAQAVEIHAPGAAPVVIREGHTATLPNGETVHVIAVNSDGIGTIERKSPSPTAQADQITNKINQAFQDIDSALATGNTDSAKAQLSSLIRETGTMPTESLPPSLVDQTNSRLAAVFDPNTPSNQSLPAKIGVEIELSIPKGSNRKAAAEKIQSVLGAESISPYSEGFLTGKEGFEIIDPQGRAWRVLSDASVYRSAEIISPPLETNQDFLLLSKIIGDLHQVGFRSYSDGGTHIHIDGKYLLENPNKLLGIIDNLVENSDRIYHSFGVGQERAGRYAVKPGQDQNLLALRNKLHELEAANQLTAENIQETITQIYGITSNPVINNLKVVGNEIWYGRSIGHSEGINVSNLVRGDQSKTTVELRFFNSTDNQVDLFENLLFAREIVQNPEAASLTRLPTQTRPSRPKPPPNLNTFVVNYLNALRWAGLAVDAGRSITNFGRNTVRNLPDFLPGRATDLPSAVSSTVTDAVSGATAGIRNSVDDLVDAGRVLTNCGVAMSPIPQVYAAGGGCITIPSGKTDVPELGEGVSVKPDPAAQAVEIYTPGAEPVVVRQGETGVLPTGEKVHVVAVKSDGGAVMETIGSVSESLPFGRKPVVDVVDLEGPPVPTAKSTSEAFPESGALEIVPKGGGEPYRVNYDPKNPPALDSLRPGDTVVDVNGQGWIKNEDGTWSSLGEEVGGGEGVPQGKKPAPFEYDEQEIAESTERFDAYERDYGMIPENLQLPKHPEALHLEQEELIRGAVEFSKGNDYNAQPVIDLLGKKNVSVNVYNEQQLYYANLLIDKYSGKNVDPFGRPLPASLPDVKSLADVPRLVQKATENGSLIRVPSQFSVGGFNVTDYSRGLLGGKKPVKGYVFILNSEEYGRTYRVINPIDQQILFLQKLGHEAGHVLDDLEFGLGIAVSDIWASELRQKQFNSMFYAAVNETNPSISAAKLSRDYGSFLSTAQERSSLTAPVSTIGKASSFTELKVAVRKQGGIRSSSGQFYSASELEDIIDEIANGRLESSYATRADGFRAKVDELLKQQGRYRSGTGSGGFLQGVRNALSGGTSTGGKVASVPYPTKVSQLARNESITKAFTDRWSQITRDLESELRRGATTQEAVDMVMGRLNRGGNYSIDLNERQVDRFFRPDVESAAKSIEEQLRGGGRGFSGLGIVAPGGRLINDAVDGIKGRFGRGSSLNDLVGPAGVVYHPESLADVSLDQPMRAVIDVAPGGSFPSRVRNFLDGDPVRLTFDAEGNRIPLGPEDAAKLKAASAAGLASDEVPVRVVTPEGEGKTGHLDDVFGCDAGPVGFRFIRQTYAASCPLKPHQTRFVRRPDDTRESITVAEPIGIGGFGTVERIGPNEVAKTARDLDPGRIPFLAAEIEWLNGVGTDGFGDLFPRVTGTLVVQPDIGFAGFTMTEVGPGLPLSAYPYPIPDKVTDGFLGRLADLDRTGKYHRDIHPNNVMVILAPAGETGFQPAKLMLVDPFVPANESIVAMHGFDPSLTDFYAGSYQLKTLGDGSTVIIIPRENLAAGQAAIATHNALVDNGVFNPSRPITDEKLRAIADQTHDPLYSFTPTRPVGGETLRVRQTDQIEMDLGITRDDFVTVDGKTVSPTQLMETTGRAGTAFSVYTDTPGVGGNDMTVIIDAPEGTIVVMQPDMGVTQLDPTQFVFYQRQGDNYVQLEPIRPIVQPETTAKTNLEQTLDDLAETLPLSGGWFDVEWRGLRDEAGNWQFPVGRKSKDTKLNFVPGGEKEVSAAGGAPSNGAVGFAGQRLSEESEIHQQQGSHRQTEGDSGFKVEIDDHIAKVSSGFFHGNNFLNINAANKDIVANKKLIVNNANLNFGFRLGSGVMTMPAMNQPAERLTNQSEAKANQISRGRNIIKSVATIRSVVNQGVSMKMEREISAAGGALSEALMAGGGGRIGWLSDIGQDYSGYDNDSSKHIELFQRPPINHFLFDNLAQRKLSHQDTMARINPQYKLGRSEMSTPSNAGNSGSMNVPKNNNPRFPNISDSRSNWAETREIFGIGEKINTFGDWLSMAAPQVYAAEKNSARIVPLSVYKMLAGQIMVKKMMESLPEADRTTEKLAAAVLGAAAIANSIPKTGVLSSTEAGYTAVSGTGGIAAGAAAKGIYRVAAEPVPGLDLILPEKVNVGVNGGGAVMVGVTEGKGRVKVVGGLEWWEKPMIRLGEWINKKLTNEQTDKLTNKLIGARNGTVLAAESEAPTATVPLTVQLFIDENKNGKMDSGEEPAKLAGVKVNLAAETKTVSYNLTEGWNFVAFPVVPESVKTAAELIRDVALDGGYVTTVSTWDGDKWLEFSQRGGEKFGQDFELAPGRAYFLNSHQDSTWTLAGTPLPEGKQVLQLRKGWNGVGLPEKVGTAVQFMDDLQMRGEVSETADQAARWDFGLWDVVVKRRYSPEHHEIYGRDFPIKPQEGYFIHANEDTTLQ